MALVLTACGSFFPTGAFALPQLTNTMVRLNDMHATHTSTGTVCFQPTTSTTEKFILVGFPTQFTLSTTLGNWTTDTTNHPNTAGDLYWPSGAHQFPNTLTATNVNTGTNVVTFQIGVTLPTLNTAFNYCFNWNNPAAITSVGAAGVDLQGTVETQDTTPNNVDIGYYALTVVADDTISVSAVVPPVFEMTIPFNTDAFVSNLSPSAKTLTGGVTPTIKTNAKGGWIMWAKDSNQALDSASTGGTIPSVGWNTHATTTLTNGVANYALSVVLFTVGGAFSPICTGHVDSEYDTAGGGDGGAFFSNYEQLGDCSGGPSNGDGLTLKEAATMSVVTPAATDYSDIITVVGAGLF